MISNFITNTKKMQYIMQMNPSQIEKNIEELENIVEIVDNDYSYQRFTE